MDPTVNNQARKVTVFYKDGVKVTISEPLKEPKKKFNWNRFWCALLKYKF